jgi:hypothetical protein
MEPELPNPYAAPNTHHTPAESVRPDLPAGRYGPYRDNRRLARWLVGWLVFGLAVHVARIAVNFIYAFSTLLDDENRTERVESVFGIFQLTAIGCMIVFCVWILRSAKNAWLFAELRQQGARIGTSASPAFPNDSPGWALGWFFIPIASFWKPFGAMRDIVRASTLDAGLAGWLLPVWWTLWLAALVTDRVATKLESTAADWEALHQLAFWTSVSGIEIALHTVAVLLVGGLTRLQAETARVLATPEARP